MNPGHQEFLLWQSYYARKHELEIFLDDEDSKQNEIMSSVKEIVLNDLTVVKDPQKFLLKKRFDSLGLGPQSKIESDKLLDTLTLCLNWVSQLTNERHRHCNPNYLPLKYKFPMDINDSKSQLFKPWTYLRQILVSEYNAISIIFNDINVQYTSCCDAEEFLSAMNIVQHKFETVLMEFESNAHTDVMKIDRKNILTRKDDVIQLTEFLKKLISIIRKVGTYVWALKIVIKKIDKNSLNIATALLPFQHLTLKDLNHGA